MSGGGLGVSASVEGRMHVWESATGVTRRTLTGHKGDVYTCKFFPSGLVVVSSGADMQLKIWSAEDGSCPVTLIGHTQPVTDLAIVDRGKNILSVSKDGCVRLWSCGARACLGTIDVEEAINCCDLVDAAAAGLSLGGGGGRTDPHPDEVATENKLLAVGCESGTVACVDVRGRRVVSRGRTPAAVNALVFLSAVPPVVAVGGQDGAVRLYAVPIMTQPVHVWHDSDSPVESLLCLRGGLLVGRHDGSCIWYPPAAAAVSERGDAGGDRQRIVLSGADADPVYSLSCDARHVFAAARDGRVRKYGLADMFP